eukprot:6530357-Prymnesium_polylepis.1
MPPHAAPHAASWGAVPRCALESRGSTGAATARSLAPTAEEGEVRRGHPLHAYPKKWLMPPPLFEEQVVRAMGDSLDLSGQGVSLAKRGAVAFFDGDP